MFQISETDGQLQIRMSAMLEAIEQADDRVVSWLTRHDSPVNLFATRMLLHEALLNAVTHGSGQDPDKSVVLNLDLREGELLMTVEDSGPGFAWNRESAMDTLAQSGRGLALMKVYSDSMHFNERGNRITLSKKFEVAQETART